MINHDYLIDSSWCDSGGSCDVMPIRNHPDLVFKSFKYEHKAKEAYNNQIKLSKLDLAPKVLSKLCQIAYYFDPKILEYWNPNKTTTDIGYISEFASLIPSNKKPLKDIQNLVKEIFNQTNMEFWDCHIENVGYIKRKHKTKLVCIDTGKESFCAYSNAWGFNFPGPQCSYCLKYQCNCSYDGVFTIKEYHNEQRY